jgi:tagatose-1,6-bisphosphate aldolase non-catalytic subunit AgaZ/GatZ
MTLPTYSAIQFHSEQEHQAALYDACLLIVNTYNQTDMLDGYDVRGVTSYDFMKFARRIIDNYEGQLK